MIENIIKDYGLFIIIAETVIIVILPLWQFIFSGGDSEIIDKLEQEKKALKKQLMQKNKLLNDSITAFNKVKHELSQYKDGYAQTYQNNTREESKTNVVEFDLSQDQKQQVSTSQVQYQYLQEANYGKFMRLLSSPEKCYFRTWEEDGVRKYEFCGNVAKALANINAIFDDVCEIEGKRGGATDIENVSAGILDSELRITSKAKIRLK